ncbi:MAG: protein-glutamate O-methyltransferase CheR [Myxococcota bacterium]
MSAAPLLREDDLTFMRRFIADRSAIVLDDSKDYLLEARLLPLAEDQGFSSLAELVSALRSQRASPALVKLVVEAMTTNETSFFRDMAPFDCLKSLILPELSAARAHRRCLNLWCGAASSGQEPYSILLLAQDVLPNFADWRIRLLATDLSSKMIERTRAGSYSQLEVNRGLPAKMLVRSFERQGMRWQIRPELRALVDAQELNLIDAWPHMPAMDVIFLRNVLIYFDVPTKQSILHRIKSVLAPDGYLFLGGAETTLGIDEGFDRVDFPNASCYRLRGG